MGWASSELRWINIGEHMWVRVDQIESVRRDSRRRAVVQMISGQEYLAGEQVSIRQVLDRMVKNGETND